MTAAVAWGLHALMGSTILMLLVLAVRNTARKLVGARLAYLLWALPAIRLIMPPLPIDNVVLASVADQPGRLIATAPANASFADVAGQHSVWTPLAIAVAIWAIGAAALLVAMSARHFALCSRIRGRGTPVCRLNSILILKADVDGPISFGVFRRVIAIPRWMTQSFDVEEVRLAIDHERGHHLRGDLVANWVALVVLGMNWWNPVAWLAARAFHDDQEYATDAFVLAAAQPGDVRAYATLLAKASTAVDALPVCSLKTASNLRRRLTMLGRRPQPPLLIALGCAALALIGCGALAATAATASAEHPDRKPATTIGIKPDGTGSYLIILQGKAFRPGEPLPDGLRLPDGFEGAGGCDLSAAAKPLAMVVKGVEGNYAVTCAGPAASDVLSAAREGAASLSSLRKLVLAQPAGSRFPEAERTRALSTIDRSMNELRLFVANAG